LKRVRVGVAGATGYTGMELIRILKNHPNVEITFLSSRKTVGMNLKEIRPFIDLELTLEPLDVDRVVERCDLLFTAIPSGAFTISKDLVKKGVKLIDLGADFRFDDPAIHDEWYENKIENYGELKRVYGLPEVNRDEIKKADVVGNPGCYPTSVIIPLYPILREKMITENRIVIDSKSGTSGAGHNPREDLLFSEMEENLRAYRVLNHRHVPEMEQELSKIFGKDLRVHFTPHILPMTRGILSTIYLKTKFSCREEIYRIFMDYYSEEKFVRILKEGYPSTKWVRGTNNIMIGFELDEEDGTLVVLSVIDNLIKGASGQAVQNMNILFDLPEDAGLNLPSLYP